ncbi:MAG TPA: hypothetical protein VFY15_02615 [Acidimicrobiia bacterium]|nr:hypothetical protein [Acidimicrobiia bacterium]
MKQRLAIMVTLALVASACTYESSGTTTTSAPLPGEEPVATSPADIVAIDQRSEGSSVIVESLSMPSAGWVVARLDAGGSPGELIGISELVSKGVSTAVAVPFLVPISENTTVHLIVHVDADSNGEFLYEAPDSLVDSVATTAGGNPAAAIITVGLLPPLGPASALLDPQVTDGTTVAIAGGLLPAAGFIALHADAGGVPGEVLAVSGLLPAGELGAFVLDIDPALVATAAYHAVAWVDRDEDGVFTPGEEGDQMAVTEDGSLAAGVALITVLARTPASIDVSDQEVASGGQFLVATLVAPAPGFIEILRDSAGSPGTRLAVATITAGTTNDLAIPLPGGVGSGTRLWLRLWVDFDQSGSLTAGDLVALDEPDGDPVEESFVVTIG